MIVEFGACNFERLPPLSRHGLDVGVKYYYDDIGIPTGNEFAFATVSAPGLDSFGGRSTLEDI